MTLLRSNVFLYGTMHSHRHLGSMKGYMSWHTLPMWDSVISRSPIGTPSDDSLRKEIDDMGYDYEMRSRQVGHMSANHVSGKVCGVETYVCNSTMHGAVTQSLWSLIRQMCLHLSYRWDLCAINGLFGHLMSKNTHPHTCHMSLSIRHKLSLLDTIWLNRIELSIYIIYGVFVTDGYTAILWHNDPIVTL